MLRRAWGAVGVVLVATTLAVPARAHAQADQAPSGTPAAAAAWVLVDAETGAVLAALNHRRPRYVASLTKVMTAYTALERLRPGTVVKISARAAAQPAMRIGLAQGQRWQLKHLLHSLLIVSANDAAYALAEASGGTVERFARQMQRTAKRMGATDGRFLDPAGLDGAEGFGGGSTASARDMAVVARNAMSVPLIRRVAAKPTYDFIGGDGKAHHLVNHNRMLELFPGTTGLKTGYTRAAGRTLIASARRDGRELIAVVLDAPDPYGTAAALIDQGFNTAPGTKGVGEKLPALAPKPAAVSGAAAASSAAPQAEAGGGGGFSPWGLLQRPLAVVFLLLFVLVSLRRRAVKRQRARRLARRRAYLEARRRGMLEVVDLDGFGSYGEVAERRRHVHVLEGGAERWMDAERASG